MKAEAWLNHHPVARLIWKPGYEFVYAPPVVPPKTDDEERDRQEGTLLWTRVVESVVRSHIEQWMWIHRRWKNQPGNPRLARLPKELRPGRATARGESEVE